MRRLVPMFLLVTALLAACSDTAPGYGQPTPSTLRRPFADPTVTTRVDSAAVLARYGFEVCEGIPPAGTVTAERGEAIVFAAVDAGIAGGGSSGGDGYRATVGLFVLDDRSLAALARLAKPSEVCVTGQDPNDYVEPGPQRLDGPGWRWIGAGSSTGVPWPYTLVTDQAAYDRLWPLLGEGPEAAQAPVDFTRQVILTIEVAGVDFGSCGQRFDGIETINGILVLDLFAPGGSRDCALMMRSATYAVALDRAVVGPPPLRVAQRRLPTMPPGSPVTVEDNQQQN